MGRREVFLSYSGVCSYQMADGLAGIIAAVMPSVTPKMFPHEPGRYVVEELTRALNRIDYAVLCVTPENRRSRWTHFEAGALMKPLGRNRVVPFCYDIDVQKLDDPLKWFGGINATADGAVKLLRAMADRFRVSRPPADTIKRMWADTHAQLLAAQRNLDSTMHVGRDARNHNRILDCCQVVQDHKNDFRRYVCHAIIADVYAAVNELASVHVEDHRTVEQYIEATVGRGRDRGALAQAGRVYALCGGKNWNKESVKHYYRRNYEFAARLSRRASRGRTKYSNLDSLVTRVFVEPKTGPFAEQQLKLIHEHWNHRHLGVAALVVPSAVRLCVDGIEPIIRTLLDDEFGIFIAEGDRGSKVFTHIGGGDGHVRFRFARYEQPLSVAAIRGLFDVIRSIAVPFDPTRWPLPTR